MAMALRPVAVLDCCSAQVLSTIENARAPSTRALYDSKWRFFAAWCADGGVDPRACSLQTVLSFLQSLLEEGRTASTLKVYIAALAGRLMLSDGTSLGAHKLVSAFLKGAKRLAPPRAPRYPPWDLPLVLDALCQAPFEPMERADLKWISYKTAFLLAVCTAKRRGELHALSVSPLCLQWGLDDSSVRLRSNAAFLPKVLDPSFVNHFVVLPAYLDCSDTRGRMLCPVQALRAYVSATSAVRQTDQLFVCFSAAKLGHPLSKQRLSHWLVTVIRGAYTAVGRPLPAPVTGHSVRSIATSWAALRGISLEEICAAATWSSPCTFSRFYRVNVAAAGSLSAAVLSGTSS